MILTLSNLLDDAILGGAFPAAQACVISHGEVIHSSAHGEIPDGPTTTETLFDVASLTKVVATTSLAFALLSRGIIQLDDRAIPLLPELAGTHKAEIRIRHLLAHTSGLPAWLPLFADAAPIEAPRSATGGADPDELQAKAFDGRRQRVIDLAASAPLERFPGAECVYSDLGFILLGELLSRSAGLPLDELCKRSVIEPLGLTATGFRPLLRELGATSLSAWSQSAVAPTGDTRPRPPAPGQERFFPGLIQQSPRSPEPPGVVDDDNAWAMGGVAGHAGLFSTAADIARWGNAILEERRGAGRLGDPNVLEEMLRRDAHQGPGRALGFDLPTDESSSAGSLLGRAGPLGAAGHLGFTGCSIWIDFDRQLSVALLTNRVFPTRTNVEGIRVFRPTFHDAVIETLRSPKG